MSEWQIPQNLMSIRTSFGPSSRRSISKGPSGASGASVPTARAVVVFEAGAVKVLVAMRPRVVDLRRNQMHSTVDTTTEAFANTRPGRAEDLPDYAPIPRAAFGPALN